MDKHEEASSLERVRERLYDPKAPPVFEEPALPERPIERARGWDRIKAVHKEVRHEAQFISGPARFLIVALLFFLLTAGGGLVYLLWGGRSVSSSNVDMAIQGPTTIASGDVVPLLVTVENRNPVPIKNATLTIIFPAGTKSADDPAQDLTLYTESLGDIEAGGKADRTVRAAVFGSEGQRVALPIKIEYHTDGSNATFVNNKEYDFVVSTSPVTVTVDALSQVSSGQPITVDVAVASNATASLNDVAVIATYPFGFAFSSASPQPTGPANAIFSLGALSPGETRHITVRGTLSGQNNDDRIFKFDAGTLPAPNSLSLSSTYTSKVADVKITAPFIATTLSINHDTSDSPVIDPGVPVQATVTWTNTLPTPVTNAKVTVALSGDALDASNVATSGFYDSSTETVLFGPSTNPALATLEPGDTGQGTFTFRTKSAALLAALRNPSVSMRVSVSGQRLSEANVPETITSTLSRDVKVGTNLSLSSRAVHASGPFKNTGPTPPVPNQETTYTIIYTIRNSGNSVASTEVTASLPPYVRFTGATSPADGSLTYNDTTRAVTWDVGDVASGATRSVAFQVALTPSTSQSGSSPVILSAQQVTGVDRFTSREITGTVSALTTETATDSGYVPGVGTVQ